MKIATFERELELYTSDYTCVVGVDEAGRGPLAGPVVACACALKSEFVSELSATESLIFSDPLWEHVRDSKTLSEKRREEVYAFICDHYDVGVGIVSAQTIDRMNILEGTFDAMRAALSDLSRTREVAEKAIVLVDGNAQIKNYTGEQKTITKGDTKVKCIAAASIVAKVTRDRMMFVYDKQYPEYGFAQHKG